MDSEISQLRDRRREIERAGGRRSGVASEKQEIAQARQENDFATMPYVALPHACTPYAAAGGGEGPAAQCSPAAGGAGVEVTGLLCST